jgi:hypothetical protein
MWRNCLSEARRPSSAGASHRTTSAPDEDGPTRATHVRQSYDRYERQSSDAPTDLDRRVARPGDGVPVK